MKDGQRLGFDLTCIAESNYARQIETLLQHRWRDIGVDATIKNVNSSLMFENGTSGTLQGGHYDVALFSWNAAADPDNSAIYSGDNLAPHGLRAGTFIGEDFENMGEGARGLADAHKRHIDRRE